MRPVGPRPSLLLAVAVVAFLARASLCDPGAGPAEAPPSATPGEGGSKELDHAAVAAFGLRAVAAVLVFLLFLAGGWYLTWRLVLSKINFFREVFGFHKLRRRRRRRGPHKSE